MATNDQHWKQKAIERRLALKELNKRKKELILSRENWKAKYLKQKQRADHFENKLHGLKKKLTHIIAT